MGIRFYCPNGHKLNVKEFQAGRKGICPFCGVKMRIPLESTRPSTKGSGGESFAPPPKDGEGDGSGDTVWEFDYLEDSPQAGVAARSGPPQVPPAGSSPGEPAKQSPAAPAPSGATTGRGFMGHESPATVAAPSTPAAAKTAAAPAVATAPTAAAPVPAAALLATAASAAGGQPAAAPAAVWAEPAAVPAASAAPSPKPADPLSEAAGAVWYVRPTSGGQFGPANAEIMRTWLAEGRIGAESLVWREGWRDWREAGGVFPQLAAGGAFPGLDRIVPEPVPEPFLLHNARHHKRPRRVPLVFIFWLGVAVVALLVILLLILYRQSH